MRLLLSILLLCSACGQALAQYQPWAIQWLQHSSTAKAGREYLGIYGTSGTNYLPGANITFTPSGPYAYVIDATGGGGGSSNYVLKSGDTMTGPLITSSSIIVSSADTFISTGNGALSTNGQMVIFGDLNAGYVPTLTLMGTFAGHTNQADIRYYYGTGVKVNQNLIVQRAGGDATVLTANNQLYLGTNAGFDGTQWYGNGLGLSNVPTVGLSVTQSIFLVALGSTNLYTNVFANGLLVASGPAGAGHGPSILLENGSYILLEVGGSLLKE